MKNPDRVTSDNGLSEKPVIPSIAKRNIWVTEYPDFPN